MRARSLAALALAAALLASAAVAASSRPPRVVATVRNGRGPIARDAGTSSVEARIALGGNPEDVALASGAAWVPNENGTVSRIDPATNAVTATIRVGADPDNAVFCRGRLWVSSLLGPRLYAIDPA